jgi:hypothetical protein
MPGSPSAPCAGGAASTPVEVVLRTQSADAEPGAGGANDPVPPPRLAQRLAAGLFPRSKHAKARVHPSPGDKPGSAGGTAVHVNAASNRPRLSGRPPQLDRSSSVFDLLENQRRRHVPAWKKRLGAWLDGIPFTIISIIFTMMVSYKKKKSPPSLFTFPS